MNDSQAPANRAPQPLPASALYTYCDPAALPFDTTADIEPLDEVIGQKRAVDAIRFAIGIAHDGFNLFAVGPEGIGKYTLVRRFLERNAADEPVPSDWCYVNNFKERHKPNALRLPPGRGRPLARDMERLVDELRATLTAAFESDEYRQRRSVIVEQSKEQHEEGFNALQERAGKLEVAIIRTPMGLAVAPVKDGEVLKPDEFEKLPEDERKKRMENIEAVQAELAELLHDLPKAEKKEREGLKELNREVSMYAVGFLIDELKKRWSDQPEVLSYLDEVRDDVVEHVDDFLPQQEQQQQMPPFLQGTADREQSPFRRYQVNVLIDHGAKEDHAEGAEAGSVGPRHTDGSTAGAPVVYEDNPTQPNLVGRVEHLAQFGALVTDFNLIKAGALHRANGGYLLLDARKLLMQPFAWESLKRALRSRCVRIESPAEALGWVTTVSLEPEPIPLEVRVVLFGEPTLYYLLSHYDPEFRELFKVMADFDSRMDRNGENGLDYARLIGTLARREKLEPLDRGAVARMVEHGARIAGDSEKLTTHMSTIVDVIREADYWAGIDGAEVISVQHVQRAIDAKVARSDRIRDYIQEEIRRGTLVIETAGAQVGQVNGLAVLGLNDFMFGKPSRISCRVRLGKGDVIDIEREVALGGPLHAKGVLILSSFLSTRYARDKPLSLSANLVFEQSYGGVEGDSASSTELYALMSAISGIPLKQSLAVTGSVDQHGRVQAIGGVNEKIEGFFDVCRARGLDGEHGVLIPAANVKHLMLRGDVVEAVRAGRFRVYAVSTIDQGIEILTGISAGAADEQGAFPPGTVNRAVARGLDAFSRRVRELAAETRALAFPGGDEAKRR